jgi:hypothetical protein
MKEQYWIKFSANTAADALQVQIDILRSFSVGNFVVKYKIQNEDSAMMNNGTLVCFDTATDADEIYEAVECGLDDYLTERDGE